MADDHDLALVKSGSKELERVDLRQADLGGLDFFNADLRGSQLDGANFTKANLVAANLKNASMVRANFSGADLRGAKLPEVAVAVKFVGANLRGTRVRLRGQVIDFRGADLVGADFTGSHFETDVLFDDVEVDDTSNFNGVEMLRATSRYPAFSAYDYHQGKLIRRNDLPSSPQPSSDEALVIVNNTKRTNSDVSHVTRRLQEHPQELALMAAVIAANVRLEIENIQSSRPNESVELAYFERYSTFLETLASSLEALTAEIGQAAKASTKQEYSKAGQTVEAIRKRIEDWCATNAEMVSGLRQTGTIGLGIAFLSLCGAPATFASAISAATFGGPRLAKTIKDYWGKAGN